MVCSVALAGLLAMVASASAAAEPSPQTAPDTATATPQTPATHKERDERLDTAAGAALIDRSAHPVGREDLLVARIDELLASDLLSDARFSVSVVDMKDGRTLYEKHADTALNPASNVKLLTTAGALALLGSTHRFETVLLADPDDLRGSTIHGDLWMRGDGDPTLVTADAYELALRLRTRGISKITGKIIVDRSQFALPSLPPGFEQKDEFASYRAPGGATSVNFNTYVLWVVPRDNLGKPAGVRIEPPVDIVKLVNNTTMVAGRRSRPRVEVERNGKETRLIVSGKIARDGSPLTFRYPTYDAEAYAAKLMAMALRDVGVRVDKRKYGVSDTPAPTERLSALARHRSDSVAVLIRAVNKHSNNFVAEQLLRSLDQERPATVSGSLSAIRSFADSIGVRGPGLELGNGSGLYDSNRISARHITAVLTHMHGDFRHRADYISSLAIMGVDGTTRKRLSSSASAGWIRAKTGTLDGVSALSGYAGAPDRSPLAFSILVNDFSRWKVGSVRKVQNAIAETLVMHLVSGLEPAPEPAPGAQPATP